MSRGNKRDIDRERAKRRNEGKNSNNKKTNGG